MGYNDICALHRYFIDLSVWSIHVQQNAIFNFGASFTVIFTLLLSKFSVCISIISADIMKCMVPLETLMVLLIWIQLNSMILLIGFEINANIAINESKGETFGGSIVLASYLIFS